MDGPALFDKCLSSEKSFIDDISKIMKSGSIPPQSMKSIYKLLFKNKMEWNNFTIDELIEDILRMCLNNISSIIIDKKINGNKLVNFYKMILLNYFIHIKMDVV